MLLVDLRTKAVISLHNINRPVFITETECVYCAVRTVYLSEMEFNLCLKACPLAQIMIAPAQE